MVKSVETFPLGSVSIDPRLELVLGIFAKAGSREFQSGYFSPYRKELNRLLDRAQPIELIELARVARAESGISHNAVCEIALLLDDRSFTYRSTLSFQDPRDSTFNGEDFSRLLRGLLGQKTFAQEFQRLLSDYRGKVARSFPEGYYSRAIGFLKKHLSLPDSERFVCICSPLFGDNGCGVRIQSNRYSTNYGIVGLFEEDVGDTAFTESQDASLLAYMVHELAHGPVHALFDQDIPGSTDHRSVLTEGIVYSLEYQFCIEYGFTSQTKFIREHVSKHGYGWVRLVFDVLDNDPSTAWNDLVDTVIRLHISEVGRE